MSTIDEETMQDVAEVSFIQKVIINKCNAHFIESIEATLITFN